MAKGTNNKNNIFLYQAESGKLSAADLAKAIKAIGIKTGDVIFVHSDVGAFGKIIVADRELFFGSIVDVLKKAVGKSGTIIMPTFTYSIGAGKFFDVEKTPSTVGALTEYFRNSARVRRTVEPIFSVAIWGKQQKALLKIGRHSLGKDSIFERFHKMGGKILLLGTRSCTFFHYIENIHGVPYRFEKPFIIEIKNKSKIYKDEFIYYARRFDFKNNVSHFSIASKDLAKRNLFKKVKIGNSAAASVKSDVLFKEVYKKLDKDVNYYLNSGLTELEEKRLI
ncbi:MAG TPA: AAC(3) family N-acetyltransferase [Candidatus Paceibacterota bacterium]